MSGPVERREAVGCLRVDLRPLVDEALKKGQILAWNIAGAVQRRHLKIVPGVDVSALVNEIIRDRHLLGVAGTMEWRKAKVVFRLQQRWVRLKKRLNLVQIASGGSIVYFSCAGRIGIFIL